MRDRAAFAVSDEFGLPHTEIRKWQEIDKFRDVEAAPDRAPVRPFRWAHQDSNLGPIDYESTALTN